MNGLRKHGSDNIRQLAKTLIAYEFDLSLSHKYTLLHFWIVRLSFYDGFMQRMEGVGGSMGEYHKGNNW